MFPQQGFQRRDGCFDEKILFHPAPPGEGELLAQTPVANQLLQRVRERGGLRGRNEEAGFPIDDRFGNAGNAGRNHRAA